MAAPSPPPRVIKIPTFTPATPPSTLALADNGQLKAVIRASSSSNNSISGVGTATLNGDFIIDTTPTDGLSSGTWLLEDVTTITGGTYGSTFQVLKTDGSPWTAVGSNGWIKSNGGTTYSFTLSPFSQLPNLQPSKPTPRTCHACPVNPWHDNLVRNPLLFVERPPKHPFQPSLTKNPAPIGILKNHPKWGGGLFGASGLTFVTSRFLLTPKTQAPKHTLLWNSKNPHSSQHLPHWHSSSSV